MIPKRYIEEWKVNAPWPLEAQTEQDLVIERALVEIFSDELLFNNLAFRGGVAVIFIKNEGHRPWEEDLTTDKTSEELRNDFGKASERFRKK